MYLINLSSPPFFCYGVAVKAAAPCSVQYADVGENAGSIPAVGTEKQMTTQRTRRSMRKQLLKTPGADYGERPGCMAAKVELSGVCRCASSILVVASKCQS